MRDFYLNVKNNQTLI